MVESYKSFEELTASEPYSYAVSVSHGARREVAILAPHAGGIEPGTGELARAIARCEFGLYVFEGRLQSGNRRLHLTSHRFDDPACVGLVAEADIGVGIHGCAGKASRVCVGGRDRSLVKHLERELRAAGLPVAPAGHEFPALSESNVCNRTRRAMGAQLEISRDLRTEKWIPQIASAVRRAINAALFEIGPKSGSANGVRVPLSGLPESEA